MKTDYIINKPRPVYRRLDNAVHYPLDSDLSAGQRYTPFEPCKCFSVLVVINDYVSVV